LKVRIRGKVDGETTGGKWTERWGRPPHRPHSWARGENREFDFRDGHEFGFARISGVGQELGPGFLTPQDRKLSRNFPLAPAQRAPERPVMALRGIDKNSINLLGNSLPTKMGILGGGGPRSEKAGPKVDLEFPPFPAIPGKNMMKEIFFMDALKGRTCGNGSPRETTRWGLFFNFRPRP